MNNTIKFSVDTQNSGKRLDVFLTENIENYTRSFLKKLIENKQVKLNNNLLISPSTKIKFRDLITVHIVQKNDLDIIPKKIKLDIVFEDKDILVLNKPKGMVVHPGAGNYEDTLVNALLYKYKKNLSDTNGELRPGIVHRLDKYTSGVMVAAKSQEAHHGLSTLFAKHRIHRKYESLCWGVPSEMTGTIDAPLGRHFIDRKKQTIRENGRSAITHYRVIKLFPPFGCHIECSLETGRTHQIRVHSQACGNPIIGDKKYGKHDGECSRLCLHAMRLSFVKDDVKYKFEAPIGEDLEAIWRQIDLGARLE